MSITGSFPLNCCIRADFLEPSPAAKEDFNEWIIDLFDELVYQDNDAPFRDYSKASQILAECIALSGKDTSVLKKALNEYEAARRADFLEDHHNLKGYYSLLSCAIQSREVDLALQLIELNVDSIHPQELEPAPLYFAVDRDSLPLVSALLKQGANPNAVSHIATSEVPLERCVDKIKEFRWEPLKCEKYFAMFDLLLKAGADPNALMGNLESIFSYCIRNRLERNGKPLYLDLWDKADLSKMEKEPGRYYCTPLHAAVYINSPELIERLIKEKNADPNIMAEAQSFLKSANAYSPLQMAVLKDRKECAKVLMQHKADPNQRLFNPFYGTNIRSLAENSEPLTSFHMAVLKENEPMAKLIMKESTVPLEDDVGFVTTSATELDLRGIAHLDYRVKEMLVKEAHEVPLKVAKLRCYSEVNTELSDNNIVEAFDFCLFDRNKLTAARHLIDPILSMMALESKKRPEFGIYFVKKGKGGGYIPHIGNIYINSENQSNLTIVAVAVHEGTHLAAHKIYKNIDCCPTDPLFEKAAKADLKALEKNTDAHWIIKSIFGQVKEYNDHHHLAECLARIPQAAAMLALCNPQLKSDEIDKILMKHIPNLFTFYVKDFLPRCEEAAPPLICFTNVK